METYSTNEERIGTWIDGKPIYRKVVAQGKSGSTISIDVSSLNIETFIKGGGIHTFNTSGRYTFPYANGGTTISVEYGSTTKKFSIYSIASGSAYAIYNVIAWIEYTKTTD